MSKKTTQLQVRTEVTMLCVTASVQFALCVYSSFTPCSSDSRKTSNSAQQGCISMIIILFLTRHLVYILILWRCTPRGGGDPEKYTLFIHYSNQWQQGCPIAKRGDVIWQQMKRKSEAVNASISEFSQLAQHYMFAWVQDKAQFVLTHGKINIAINSVSFSLPCIFLSSLLFLVSPCCWNKQSANTAGRFKIFTYSVLAESWSHYLNLSDVYQSNKPKDWLTYWGNCSFLTTRHPPYLQTNTLIYSRKSSLSRTSIWFLLLLNSKLAKKSKYSSKSSHLPYSRGCISATYPLTQRHISKEIDTCKNW